MNEELNWEDYLPYLDNVPSPEEYEDILNEWEDSWENLEDKLWEKEHLS